MFRSSCATNLLMQSSLPAPRKRDCGNLKDTRAWAECALQFTTLCRSKRYSRSFRICRTLNANMDNSLQARLVPLRERIDALDEQILELLNQRAIAAQDVGKIKQDFDVDGPVLKPEREAMVIRRLQALNKGPFTDQAVDAVWTQIISTCRGLESALAVAYLGPQGSFSEQAALEHFGHAVTRVRCDSFDEVFRAVEAGQADVGMVPVENSTEGAVNRTLDLLLNSPLKVLGERS